MQRISQASFVLVKTRQGNGYKLSQQVVPNYPTSKYLQYQVLRIAHRSLQRYDAGIQAKKYYSQIQYPSAHASKGVLFCLNNNKLIKYPFL